MFSDYYFLKRKSDTKLLSRNFIIKVNIHNTEHHYIKRTFYTPYNGVYYTLLRMHMLQ